MLYDNISDIYLTDMFAVAASSVFIVVVVATIVGMVVLIIGLMCLKRQDLILLAYAQSRP